MLKMTEIKNLNMCYDKLFKKPKWKEQKKYQV